MSCAGGGRRLGVPIDAVERNGRIQQSIHLRIYNYFLSTIYFLLQYKIVPTLHFTLIFTSTAGDRLTPRLDVDIKAWNLELESGFLNSAVWLSEEFRAGIRTPIPWYWDITRFSLFQFRDWTLCIGNRIPANNSIYIQITDLVLQSISNTT